MMPLDPESSPSPNSEVESADTSGGALAVPGSRVVELREPPREGSMAHDAIAQRVKEAGSVLFADSELGQGLAVEAERYQRDCAAIADNRGLEELTIAFIGPKKHGKSALARTLLAREELREQLPSGLRVQASTQQLYWMGPSSPEDLDPGIERYYRCPAEDMADLGTPYLILDTPGFSDREPRLRDMAREALANAQLQVLVVMRDGLEREDIAGHLLGSSGSAILPVIRTRDPEEDLAAELDAFMETLRESAPKAMFLAPVVVPDFAIEFPGELGAEQRARELLIQGLHEAVGRLPSPTAMVRARLAGRTQRFRRSVRSLMAGLQGREIAALEEFETAAEALPTRVIESFLGSDKVMTLGIRAHLRVDLSTRISGIWFPFRPIMSVVTLTQGAWDRMILGMAGSVPSLIGAFFAISRNIRGTRRFRHDDRLEKQIVAVSQDRLEPLVGRFQRALAQAPGVRVENRSAKSDAISLRMTGLSELRQSSHEIIETALDRAATGTALANFGALIGTGVFWSLFSAPLVSLYRQYIVAAQGAFGAEASLWSAFPMPHASMMLTAVVLSALPTLMFALMFVSFCLRASKVRAAKREIVERHGELIAELRGKGQLALEIGDPRLEHARFLFRM